MTDREGLFARPASRGFLAAVLAVIIVMIATGAVLIVINIAMAVANPPPWYHWAGLAALAGTWTLLGCVTARAWSRRDEIAGRATSVGDGAG